MSSCCGKSRTRDEAEEPAERKEARECHPNDVALAKVHALLDKLGNLESEVGTRRRVRRKKEDEDSPPQIYKKRSFLALLDPKIDEKSYLLALGIENGENKKRKNASK